jgi:hypothetical protein
MSAHTCKRRLHERYDHIEYAIGSIKRIKLHNFMSYSDAEVFDPGPRLNCIVGPNGTGKSSIVNALAIGLGGTLRLTDRGSATDDAIKKDCSDGYVEIELRTGGGTGKNMIVRCDLKREGGKKAEYSLDGAARWACAGGVCCGRYARARRRAIRDRLALLAAATRARARARACRPAPERLAQASGRPPRT